MIIGGWLILLLIIALIVVVLFAIRIAREYERGVVFRLGRVQPAKGPGLFFLIPHIDRMVRVDLRTVTLDVPTQEAITQDNVTVAVNAVAYFHVERPVEAVINVEDYRRATAQIAQTSLRNVIGQSTLDQMLQQRETINGRLQRIIDEATEPWGIQVTIVEIKDVELNTTMIRAMAREAEAERVRRAKIIDAEGEFQASRTLADAANTINTAPGAMTLRYLQTLRDIGIEHNTIMLFPIPIELLSGLTPHITNLMNPQPGAPKE